jgi:Dolichyl-phosphate-mannose-protein mannosyltransferase
LRSRPGLAAAHPATGTGEETVPLPPVDVRPVPAARAAWSSGWDRLVRWQLPLAGILGLAAFLRLWELTAIGFNSDEAVYTGSAASLAGDGAFRPLFPVFRAHPLIFQALLSVILRVHDTDWAARAFAAAIGVATVGLTFLLGRRLYGTSAGLVAALVLAVMPYHVIISRQVLLDGLMTLCVTAVLYCVVRYVEAGTLSWLLAGASLMGAAVLTKETSVVLLGGLYAFFALTPAARMPARHLLLALGVLVAEIAIWPLTLRLSGHARTGENYFLWQVFRRPNHGSWFYFTVLPAWFGPVLIAVVLAGLIWLRKEATWRERLLLAWLIVPLLFFTLWPVKGFQYLLPITPPLAVLAGRTLAHPVAAGRESGRPGWLLVMRRPPRPERPARDWELHIPSPRPGLSRAVMGALAAVTAISLLVPVWGHIEPSPSAAFLAGSGGLDGGRQAGGWVLHNVPRGAHMLAIGPSVANVLEFYGHRPVSALAVSPDRRNRNPAYAPVANPDLAVRRGVFQYVVWDAYTAYRTPFFAAVASRLVSKFHGVAVFTSTVRIRTSTGPDVVEPAFIIYEVHP